VIRPSSSASQSVSVSPRYYLSRLNATKPDELDTIADSLNNRPRATYTFQSPFEVFAATLASASQSPASKKLNSLLRFTLKPLAIPSDPILL
jgi:hypothetical protein